MEIKAFNQQPKVACHDAIVKEDHHCFAAHSGVAVFSFSDIIENNVFNKHRHGFQNEGHKKVHMDVVSGAVQLPKEAEYYDGDHQGYERYTVSNGVANFDGTIELPLSFICGAVGVVFAVQNVGLQADWIPAVLSAGL